MVQTSESVLDKSESPMLQTNDALLYCNSNLYFLLKMPLYRQCKIDISITKIPLDKN